MAKPNEMSLPGMIISARSAAASDADFDEYVLVVRTALENYDVAHNKAAGFARDHIMAAIKRFGETRGAETLRSELQIAADRKHKDDEANATRFNFTLAMALTRLRGRADQALKRGVVYGAGGPTLVKHATQIDAEILQPTGVTGAIPTQGMEISRVTYDELKNSLGVEGAPSEDFFDVVNNRWATRPKKDQTP